MLNVPTVALRADSSKMVEKVNNKTAIQRYKDLNPNLGYDKAYFILEDLVRIVFIKYSRRDIIPKDQLDDMMTTCNKYIRLFMENGNENKILDLMYTIIMDIYVYSVEPQSTGDKFPQDKYVERKHEVENIFDSIVDLLH